MKATLRQRRRQSGIMLIEVIAYLAVLLIVMAVGTDLLYRAWTANIALRRNADDIARTLNAGEIWRTDVRTATGPITAHSEQEFHIPNSRGEIIYEFAEGKVTRSAPGQQPRVLASVKSSEMQPDRRGDVNGWRWELELNHNHKKVQFTPLFTFEAVAETKPNK